MAQLVIIAGAGPGALALALALHRRGVPALLCEAVGALKPLGVARCTTWKIGRDAWVRTVGLGAQAHNYHCSTSGGRESLDTDLLPPIQHHRVSGDARMVIPARCMEVAGRR